MDTAQACVTAQVSISETSPAALCSALFPDTLELVSSGIGRPLTWVTVYGGPPSYWLCVLSWLKVFLDFFVKSGGFPIFLGN